MNGEKKKTETLLDTSREAELEKMQRKLRQSKNTCSYDSTRMQDGIIKQSSSNLYVRISSENNTFEETFFILHFKIILASSKIHEGYIYLFI
jgi:hypothetical protein